MPRSWKSCIYEVREFTGRSPLRKSEGGTQGAIVDDLVSAGTEALIRAAEHFDPSLGYKFQTYASKCVKNAIRRAARPRKRDAALPRTVATGRAHSGRRRAYNAARYCP